MLKTLEIRNLAVIDRIEVEFQPGLNILSGETGSGKSVILDAIESLLGARSSPEMIRTGEAKASIEGIFGITGNLPLVELLGRAGIEADDEIIIRREITQGARGRIFINNQAATAALLREAQPHLVDIHGQGEQQSLLIAGNHLNLLDAFAGDKDTRQQLEVLHEQISGNLLQVERLAHSESSRLRELDVIRFQLAEIDRAHLRELEDMDLEAERLLLANAERIREKADESYAALYDEGASILSRLGLVIRRFNDLVPLDARFAQALDQLENSKVMLEEVAYFLRDYLDGLEVSPEKLQEVEDRLVEIGKLKRKYGGTLTGVFEAANEFRRRLSELENAEEQTAQLEKELIQLMKKYRQKAGQLTQIRRQKAIELAASIGNDLADVALEKATFEVRLCSPSGGGLGERMNHATTQDLKVTKAGEETAEFYFTANPGEEAKPLREVASGGELSRLMLLIKHVTAPTLFPRTLIFDEIDAGIGGRVADSVGAKLHRVARSNQVLCVTHQAQIARYADAHFLVRKRIDGARTRTHIDELKEAERVDELARMLGGNEVTSLARRHARELLRQR
jgi:DNA repair protein RecN (Recombination protein N)